MSNGRPSEFCGKCMCCKAGQWCVYVLKLSPKDEADAVRLWRRFHEAGTEPGPVDLRPKKPPQP